MRIPRPRYADVAATLALVVALGTGGAYAADQIRTKDLAANAVTSAKIKDGTVAKADLSRGVNQQLGRTGARGPAGANGKDGTNGLDGIDGTDGLTGATGATGAPGIDGTDGTQGLQGPKGEKGEKGDTGPQGPVGPGGGDPGPAGPAGADGTDGVDGATGSQGPRGYSSWDTIPGGVTVTGRLYNREEIATGGDSWYEMVNLPGVARAALTNTTVNVVKPSDLASSTPSALVVDGDPSCTGTYAAPTAPAGTVCVYLGGMDGTPVTSLEGVTTSLDTHRKYAFSVVVKGTAGQSFRYWASWAYTSPSS